MSLVTKLFGTPEERKRRQEEQEKARAVARAKLIAFGTAIARVPPPILAALIALIGIFIGNRLTRSDTDAKWHKDRLTQIYGDCMYYSFRVESAFAESDAPEWSTIRDDVGQMLRSGNLLFAYMSGENWNRMNSVLSAVQVYSLSYASPLPKIIPRAEAKANAATKLKEAAHNLSDVASSSYRYDSRIF